MADLPVRRQGSQLQPQRAPLSRELEPLRLMRDWLGWDPFQEMVPRWPTATTPAFSPSFDIKETKDAYLFRADVPGIKEQDIDVTLMSNRLTISGKREEEAEERGETYYSSERTYGAFSRSFTLPDGADVDHVRADLKAGVLTIAIPKKPEVQPKKVAVTTSERTPKA
jgi:HSP20 family protein